MILLNASKNSSFLCVVKFIPIVLFMWLILTLYSHIEERQQHLCFSLRINPVSEV